ncbi:MAG: hypothetical protein AAB229_09230 [Candidatus Hydrogenedentota bacterium]
MVRRYRLALFLIAFSARLILPALGFNPIASDTATYLSMGRGIVDGVGMVDEAGVLTAFRSPTYPVFLAGMLKLTGGSLTGIQIIQALIASLVPLVVFEILLPHVGIVRAFLGGIILALDPISIPPSAYILTETIGAALLLLWVAAWSRSMRFGRGCAFFMTGLIGGGLVYQTMITLILHPISVGLRYLTKPRSWKLCLLSLFIFLIPMGLWTVRNRAVFGEGTAVRAGGFGFLLWASMNYDFPWLLSPYDDRGDYIFRQEKTVAKHYPPNEIHALYMRKGLARILAEPLACAMRAVKGTFWSWVEVPGAMKSLDRMPAVKWGLRGANLVILLLALAGLPGALRTPEGRIAAAVIAYFVLFHAPLYPIPRYFIPVRPELALLAAFAFRGHSPTFQH